VSLAAARAGVPRSLLESIETISVLITGLDPEAARALSEAVDSGGESASLIPGHASERPGSAILAAPIRLVERIAEAVAATSPTLARSLRIAAVGDAQPPPMRIGDRVFRFGGGHALMGVVNVTPDSFSDAGRTFDVGSAVEHGVRLAQSGADILDVGGESTRPGSSPISVEEELRRVLPVIRELRARTSVPISIDTRKSAVARAAIAEGAAMVNDVSALEFDPELARVTAEAGVSLCLMHHQGTPETMQTDPRYADVIEEIVESLEAAIARAVDAGVSREALVVDPGIGFGKTFGHNQFILRRLGDLRVLGRPVLVGFSRKGFLGALAGGKPPAERAGATAVCAAAVAMIGGADILRVHDVAEVREALSIAEAIRAASEGGALFASDRK
jgi:dihydropteroate synthase